MRQVRSSFNQQIYGQAGDWLVRHRASTLDVAGKRAFDAWLRTSPEHIRAYLEMSEVWEDLGSMDLRSGALAAELIDLAATDISIVSIPRGRGLDAQRSGPSDAVPGASATNSAKASWILRHRFRLAAAISMLCIATGLISWWTRAPSYSTGIGEQRSITLVDGSTIELNAQSEIRVRFAAHARDVDLINGQALFHVAKDSARPFIVRAGNTLVRAVGTQFDVNELQRGTEVVTVVEGLVAVFGAPGSRGTSEVSRSRDATGRIARELLTGLHGRMWPVLLGSGEQLTVAAARPVQTARVNPATTTAWTQHRFVFDAAPLAEVVTEFNRYNVRQLVIVDSRLDDFRISGLFSSADPSLLLQFLRDQPEMAVDDTGDEIRISKR